MKNLFLLSFIFFCPWLAPAQNTQYQKVKIWLDGKSYKELSSLGIDLSEGQSQKGIWFISDFSETEITEIQQAGFRVDVLIKDVSDYYRNRNLKVDKSGSGQKSGSPSCEALKPDYAVPAHFHLGSMGGFYTYAEMLNIIDSMALLYPNLITAKQAIDTTKSIEGRPLYYVKISDNAPTDEPEPEVLYTALHHAREPESLTQLIYYMWYLLENYGKDSTVNAVVNNTEMYFVPCVNPDGYVFNETSNPAGGGMWRKNRRFMPGTGGGGPGGKPQYGIDLNRNYSFLWGLDDFGSSPHKKDETYRGDSAASEPETRAIQNFCTAHNFVLALNYHTYGNHHIVPWAYEQVLLTPDSTQFDFYGNAMTKYNKYHVGTPYQTVGYITNGSSDDWMYGEQSAKAKILAMTPEVGGFEDGFWPQTDRIIPLSKENVFSNLTLAKLAGRYGTVQHQDPHYIASLTNKFYFTFHQLGMDTGGTYSIGLIPISSNFTPKSGPVIVSGLGLLQSHKDSIVFELNSSTLPGDAVEYIVSVDNGFYTESDTIRTVYGAPVLVFNDLDSAALNWDTTGSGWAVTAADFFSSPSSITNLP